MKASFSRPILKVALFFAVVVPLGLFAQPMLGDRSQVVDRGAGIRPEKRPVKPSDNDIFKARDNDAYKEFFAAYDDIVNLYRERQVLETANDPKEARRAKQRLERLERRLERGKRDFYKLAEKLRKPMDRDYEKLQERLDDLEKKAKDAEARNLEDRATKFYQEQGKYSGTHANLKKKIDLINYYLFFDEFDPDDGDNEPLDKMKDQDKDDGRRIRRPKGGLDRR
jgi:tetrahydromethanopterin S-methyltransferase subunit G